MIKTIDAQMVAKMFLGGAKNLESNKEWINELNVFRYRMETQVPI